MKFDELLRFAVKNNASDVHVQALSPPMMRIAGKIRSVESPSVSSEEVLSYISSMVPEIDLNELVPAIQKGLDFSHAIPDLSRFRCSAYRNLGNTGIVMRIIREQIPPIENLHLPKVIQDIALARRGLTLVTGTTGSGGNDTDGSQLV